MDFTQEHADLPYQGRTGGIETFRHTDHCPFSWTADESLQAAVAVIDGHKKGGNDQLEAAVADHSARCMALELCDFLTHAIPANISERRPSGRGRWSKAAAKSLLTVCLRNAAKAARYGGREAFGAALLAEIPSLLYWQVYTGRGRRMEIWDFCQGGLAEWARQQRSTPLVVPRPDFLDPRVPDRAVRCVVAGRIFSAAEISLNLGVLEVGQ